MQSRRSATARARRELHEGPRAPHLLELEAVDDFDALDDFERGCAALPDAPCVSFYQGDAHGGSRVAELAWHASMHPDRGAFADAWVSTAERAAMPPHLGVIVTYVDVRGAWHATTVATQSATQPDEWGYYAAHRLTGGECIGAMLKVPRGGSSK